MENKTEKDEGRIQAKAKLDSIVTMVNRFEHAGACNGDCQLTDKEIYDGLDLRYKGEKATDEEREEYHDEEAARTRIEEHPLEVQVRSGWHNLGEKAEDAEFEILLCTGGPAVRIVGELDGGQPSRIRLQYQDWWTLWAEYLDTTSEEKDCLLKYAQVFSFDA